MARGVNKCIIVGCLGRDPDVRYGQQGQIVVNVSLATTEAWKDKGTGEKVERTEWHRAVLFGRLAEVASEYLKKGSWVYLEGRLQTRKWQDNGVDRYTTEIIVNEMQMLGNNRAASGEAESSRPQPSRAGKAAAAAGGGSNPPPVDFDDDIPFSGAA